METEIDHEIKTYEVRDITGLKIGEDRRSLVGDGEKVPQRTVQR